MSPGIDNPDTAALAAAIAHRGTTVASAVDPLNIHIQLLAALGSAAPLGELLEVLVRYVETGIDGLVCSVMLVDPTGRFLRFGAAPNLPKAYVDATSVVPIADGEGSCGTAAARRETVIVDDIERSDLWKRCASVAVAHGLRACWSVPVLDGTERVLGTLALYYNTPRQPSDREVKFSKFAAVLTAFVIRRNEDVVRVRTSEARLRAAMTGTRIGLWEHSVSGERQWLDEWCRLIHVDPCVGHRFDERWRAQIHPADVARYRARRERSRATADASYVIDYRVRTLGGEWRWVQERSAGVMPHRDGSTTPEIGVCIDIDDRKKAEFEQGQSAERYRVLARLVGAYVFEARLLSTGNIEFTWADDEFATIFGCEREEVNRRGWQNFVDLRDRAAALERLAGLARGEVVEIELRIVATTGERRWLRMAAEPLLDAAAQTPIAVIGMAEDITHRKALMEHMFEAIHQEQRRIGSDLHDGLGQVLTGVSLLLQGNYTRSLRGEAVAPNELKQLVDLVRGAIETTRGLAYGLAPGTKEYGGLLAALQSLAQQSRRFGLTVEISAPTEYKLTLDSPTADHLYRIVQEALTNVARHAHATRVVINVMASPGVLVIELSDDGVGIADGSAAGFGLHSMQYRVAAIGAQLAIEKIQPRGTRVRVQLPLQGPGSLQ
ncbi:MAG TPA: PAS domain-containing protein [Steroidobacteraceae bacterium]|nr:PAS domain-containing protein [Steroidobacteraceae bacterium]